MIYELITALQLTTKLLYVFTYLSAKQHLAVILSATLLDRGAIIHRGLPDGSCHHSILPHTISTHASLGTSCREALPDWPVVLPAPFPAGQGCWQSRLARPHRWPEPGPPSSLRWLPPRQRTENRSEMGQRDREEQRKRTREDNRRWRWAWRRGNRGGERGHFRCRLETSEATNKGSRNQGFHPGKDISMDSSLKDQIRNQSSDLNKAVLLLTGTGCVYTIQTTKKERKCC